MNGPMGENSQGRSERVTVQQFASPAFLTRD